MLKVGGYILEVGGYVTIIVVVPIDLYAVLVSDTVEQQLSGGLSHTTKQLEGRNGLIVFRLTRDNNHGVRK